MRRGGGGREREEDGGPRCSLAFPRVQRGVGLGHKDRVARLEGQLCRIGRHVRLDGLALGALPLDLHLWWAEAKHKGGGRGGGGRGRERQGARQAGARRCALTSFFSASSTSVARMRPGLPLYTPFQYLSFSLSGEVRSGCVKVGKAYWPRRFGCCLRASEAEVVWLTAPRRT